MMLTERIEEIHKAISELNKEKQTTQSQIDELMEFEDTEELVENYEEEVSAIEEEIFEQVELLSRYRTMLVTYGENAKLW